MTITSAIVVVVATRNRCELLRERCLRSISRQHRRPDEIVIVDDSDAAYAELNERIAHGAARDEMRVLYMRMPRPSGAAAAWNRALTHIEDRGGDPWVALHDDDDCWTSDHLQRCERAASDAGANAAVSGIRLVLDGTATPQALPSKLTASDFLRGNPGWQGSNTFVRFSLLRDVGGFDETLGACLDRDLAIRLLDTGAISIAFTNAHTVDYFIDPARDALSRRGSPAKLDALRRFHAKHGARMSPADRAAFLDRAARLFGFPEGCFEAAP